MAEHWNWVAQAISDRMREQRLTQQQVAAAAQVSLTTLRELQSNTNPRRRRPQTLEAISTALRWPRGHLGTVLAGEVPAVSESEADGGALAEIRAELADLRRRVEAIEQTQRSG